MPQWEDQKLLSSSVARSASDDAGNITTAGTIEGSSTVIDPRISDFIETGVFNGAFARGPVDSNSAIDDQNPMPDWVGPTSVSGGAIIVTWITDATYTTVHGLNFHISPGAAGDEVYFDETIPAGSNRGNWVTYALRLAALATANSGAGTPRAYIGARFYDSAGNLTNTSGPTEAALTVGTVAKIENYPANANRDAASIVVRIGVKRDTMAAGDSADIMLFDVRAERALWRMLAADQTSNANDPLVIYQAGAIAYIKPALTTAIQMDFNGPSIQIPAEWMLQVGELSALPTPAAGYYGIYAKTDHQLYGKGSDGAEVPLSHIHGFTGTAAAQAIANAADDPIEWTEVVDTDAFHAGTSNAIVIPTGWAGWYTIQASATFNTGGTRREIRIQKGGADLAYGTDGNTGSLRSCIWTGKLAAADSITIVAFANAAAVTATAQVSLVFLGR